MQRREPVGIDGLGIGALVEQQRRHLRATHGGGDNQGCQTRFRHDVVRVRAGAEEDPAESASPCWAANVNAVNALFERA
jgi:hypothetical protein